VRRVSEHPILVGVGEYEEREEEREGKRHK
jgi:hypothetical protein